MTTIGTTKNVKPFYLPVNGKVRPAGLSPDIKLTTNKEIKNDDVVVIIRLRYY